MTTKKRQSSSCLYIFFKLNADKYNILINLSNDLYYYISAYCCVNWMASKFHRKKNDMFVKIIILFIYFQNVDIILLF